MCNNNINEYAEIVTIKGYEFYCVVTAETTKVFYKQVGEDTWKHKNLCYTETLALNPEIWNKRGRYEPNVPETFFEAMNCHNNPIYFKFVDGKLLFKTHKDWLMGDNKSINLFTNSELAAVIKARNNPSTR